MPVPRYAHVLRCLSCGPILVPTDKSWVEVADKHEKLGTDHWCEHTLKPIPTGDNCA